MRPIGAHRTGLAQLVLLLGLVISSAAVGQSAYMIDGATVALEQPNINYQVSPLCTPTCLGVTYIYTRGNGSAPNRVAFILFDFFIPVIYHSRFCVTGQPKMYMYTTTALISNANPAMPSSITVDLPDAPINLGNVTWNSQPATGVHYLNTSPSTAAGAPTSIPLSSELVNTALRKGLWTALFRISYTSTTSIAWIADDRFDSIGKVPVNIFPPYISYDYANCDANASCTLNGCVCNQGYKGSGTLCTPDFCAATVMLNAAFPQTSSGVTAHGTCQPAYLGAPSARCVNGVWDATKDPCIPLICPADTTSLVGGAVYQATNALSDALGECLSGYEGYAIRRCDTAGNWLPTASRSCDRIECPATRLGNANFPVSSSLTVVNATCAVANRLATAECSASGTWTLLSSCEDDVCIGRVEDNSDWRDTPLQQHANGTCLKGWTGTPTRYCNADGMWSSISSPCVPVTCPASAGYEMAHWPATTPGEIAVGACVPGYAGAPQRECLADGQWSFNVTNACGQVRCTSAFHLNANWPSNTPSGSFAVGTCEGGWTGRPTRFCEHDGTWSDTVDHPCSQAVCAPFMFEHARWPAAIAGTPAAIGTCIDGYTGTVSRPCDVNAVWGDVIGACARATCAATTEANADWPLADSLTTTTGVCKPGYAGSPTRTCLEDGVYGSVITPCHAIVCPAIRDDVTRSAWIATAANTPDTVGSCDDGFEGDVTRTCDADGDWLAISGSCTQGQCPAEEDVASLSTWAATPTGTRSVIGACAANATGSPSRDCLLNSTWSAIRNPCVAVAQTCAAIVDDESATWPAAEALGQTVRGACNHGFSSVGPPERVCNSDGTWNATVSNPCNRNICPATTEGDATWTATPSLSTANGVCDPGFEGTVSRECNARGEFGPISGACMQILCQGRKVDGATWPITAAGMMEAVGVCDAGLFGSQVATCDWSGEWSEVSGSCVQRFCPALDDSSAQALWADDVAGGSQSVAGLCYPDQTGLPSRSCNVDGTWGLAENGCTTNPCPPLFNINNADWPQPNTADQQVLGTCRQGYSSSGGPLRHCQPDGTWSATVTNACLRNACVSANLDNADWAGALSLTTAEGVCISGYHGNPTRLCLANGTYGEITSGCVPDACPATYAGHASWQVTSAGTADVTGVCDLGYVGQPVMSCDLAGHWSVVSGECTQLECPATSDVVTWPATPAGVTVFLPCPAGLFTEDIHFNLTGRECTYTGTWEPVYNPCTWPPCRSLANDFFADWPAPSAAGEEVTGTCIDGYDKAAPPPTRQCLADGTWSSSIVNPCVPLVCTTSSPSYAAFSGTWATTTAGLSATGTCPPGFTSASLPVRACQLDGTWAAPSPACEPIQCATLADDGQHAAWPATTADTTTTGTCMAAYHGAPTRHCSMNGEWSAVTDPCQLVVCANVTEGNADWRETVGGTLVTGTCVDGHGGLAYRSCLANGTWDVIEGGCAPVTCPAQVLQGITWPATSFSVTATAPCPSSYAGNLTRACNPDGVWAMPVGECALSPCAATHEENAWWPAADGSTSHVVGQCAPGWFGSPSRNCSERGEYSAITDTCTQITCPEVHGPEGTWPSTVAGTAGVAGVCAANPVLSISRDCGLDGRWGRVAGSCFAIGCSAQSFANAYWPSTPAGSHAAGTCDAGYSGDPSRLCSNTGLWSTGIGNTCQQRACSTVNEGNALWTTAVALSDGVHGTCNTGYFGDPTRQCDEFGFWGPISDPCELRQCHSHTLGNALWDSTQAGQTAVGKCNNGYWGTPTRQCSPMGVWGSLANGCVSGSGCSASRLDLIYFPATPPGSVAYGSCPEGYMSQEDMPPERLCTVNGAWEASYKNRCVQDFLFSSNTVSAFFYSNLTSTSVLLRWVVRDKFPSDARFRIEYATGTDSTYTPLTGTFPWGVTVTDLPPDTRCFFKLTPSLTFSTIKFGTAPGGFLSVLTPPVPPTQARLSVAYGDYAIVRWNAAPKADLYLIYTKLISPTRDAEDDGFELHGNVTGATLTYTVTGLRPGTNIVRIAASYRGNVDPFGTEVLFYLAPLPTTPAPTNDAGGSEESEESEQAKKEMAGTIAAAVVAPIGGIIAIVIIVVLVRRKRSKPVVKDWITMYELGDKEDKDATTRATSTTKPAATASTTNLLTQQSTTTSLASPTAPVAARPAPTPARVPAVVSPGNAARVASPVAPATTTPVAPTTTTPVAPTTTTPVAPTAAQPARVTNVRPAVAAAEPAVSPDFLVLNYVRDMRTGPPVPKSSSDLMLSGTLNPDVATRIGTRDIAIRMYFGQHSATAAQTAAAFKRVVSLMWSVSFHPNIISLIGFTERPRALIMPLISSDLVSFFTEHQGKREIALLGHLVRGISDGLAALHANSIAHRNLTSANILLQVAPGGTAYPTPVISGLHNARGADQEQVDGDVIVTSMVPYAAPEVFGHVHMGRGGRWPVSEDMASDVYALGVVLWEMCTGKVAWGGVSAEQVEQRVVAGEVLPMQVVDKVGAMGVAAASKACEAIPALLREIFVVNYANRPTAFDVYTRFHS